MIRIVSTTRRSAGTDLVVTRWSGSAIFLTITPPKRKWCLPYLLDAVELCFARAYLISQFEWISRLSLIAYEVEQTGTLKVSQGLSGIWVVDGRVVINAHVGVDSYIGHCPIE